VFIFLFTLNCGQDNTTHTVNDSVHKQLSAEEDEKVTFDM
jgi:hypothetical protein